MNMRDTACLVETHNLFTSCTKHHELQSERGTSCVPNLVAQNSCTMVKIQFKMYNLAHPVQGAAVTIQIQEIEKFFFRRHDLWRVLGTIRLPQLMKIGDRPL